MSGRFLVEEHLCRCVYSGPVSLEIFSTRYEHKCIWAFEKLAESYAESRYSKRYSV